METWTMVRFLLYPILLVTGLALAWLFARQYRSQRLPAQAWAAWLALAAGVLGLAGFGALVLSQALGGFGSVTSALLTAGLAVLTGVVVSALAAVGLAGWRNAAPAGTDGQ